MSFLYALDGPQRQLRAGTAKGEKMESIKNEKKELEFTCPQCGGHEIFEHLVNYEKVWVYEDEEMEFGESEWWESDKVEYSCANQNAFGQLWTRTVVLSGMKNL